MNSMFEVGLDELDAIWELAWETKFLEAKAFKEKYGDCLVPLNWNENPELANWICCQRDLYHQGKLGMYKEYRLNSLGFDWNFKENLQ